MSFDPNKPVQCRNGRPARIICTDRDDSDRPIVALVPRPDGERIEVYRHDGRYDDCHEYPLDLINIPEKIEGWVNIWRGCSETYPGCEILKTREQALAVRCPNERIACIKVSFTEGDGL